MRGGQIRSVIQNVCKLADRWLVLLLVHVQHAFQHSRASVLVVFLVEVLGDLLNARSVIPDSYAASDSSARGGQCPETIPRPWHFDRPIDRSSLALAQNRRNDWITSRPPAAPVLPRRLHARPV